MKTPIPNGSYRVVKNSDNPIKIDNRKKLKVGLLVGKSTQQKHFKSPKNAEQKTRRKQDTSSGNPAEITFGQRTAKQIQRCYLVFCGIVYSVHTPNSALHSCLQTPNFTLHTHDTTPHSTFYTPHSTLHTPHSHFTFHTHTPHRTLHTTKEHQTTSLERFCL